MIRQNLLISLRISLGLTCLSFFFGWLRVLPYDDALPIIPLPFQVLRIFIITFLTAFMVFTLFYYIKILFLKIKRHDK